MEATVGMLAGKVSGEVIGDAERVILDAQALRKAEPTAISFCGDDTRVRELENTQAGAILITRKKLDEVPRASRERLTYIVVADSAEAFVTILKLYRDERPRREIGYSPHAFVALSARIGVGTNIYPGAYVGNDVVIGAHCDIYPGVFLGDGVVLGDNVTIYPQATLYSDVVVGNRVIIHAAAVIGADGFGYRFKGGRFHKIPQLGTVRIDDDVEIGAGATVDRGMIGPTIVGEGSKIDNQVMIAHNCEIGRHNVFASQVGFAGSCTTGDYVRCGGQVGIANGVHLGQGSSLGAKSGVHKDIPAGETYVGYPARPHDEAFKIAMAEGKLPDMRIRLRELEKQVAALTALLNPSASSQEAA